MPKHISATLIFDGNSNTQEYVDLPSKCRVVAIQVRPLTGALLVEAAIVYDTTKVIPLKAAFARSPSSGNSIAAFHWQGDVPVDNRLPQLEFSGNNQSGANISTDIDIVVKLEGDP